MRISGYIVKGISERSKPTLIKGMNTYESLIQQLDRFIRKYYLSKMLKGVLLFSGVILSLYLLLSLGEFAFYFPSWIRWILAGGFIGVALYTLVQWILSPLAGYLNLSKGLTHEQAARIIGKHFSDVQDKLLNILQLKSEDHASGSRELIQASIRQKIDNISWVPFSQAVDLKENRKFLRYAIPPIALLVIILLISPNILSESNARLVQPSKSFAKPAPFDFIIDKKDLQVVQFKDLEVVVKVKGKLLPAQVEWIQQGQTAPMNRVDVNTFSYQLLNVQEDIAFRLTGNGYVSEEFRIKVLKKPIVSSMKITVSYPAYLQRKTETVYNTGDLVVPQGTTLTWELKGTHAEEMLVSFEGLPAEKIPATGQRQFGFSKKILKDTRYKLYLSNKDMPLGDSVLFSLTATPDQSPVILVESVPDSNDARFVYFLGNASDDYGISRLELHTRIVNEKGQIRASGKKSVPVRKDVTVDFTYQLNIYDYTLNAGDRLEYYFEVWDNDGVNGPKSAKSALFSYTLPTVVEFKNMETTNNESIKSSISSTSKEVQKLSRDIKQLKEKVLTKKNLSWEDKKETEDLLKKHDELTQELQQIKEKYDENLKNQDQFKEVDPEILQKQDQLSKMMDELLSQEMKDLMKELEALLEKFQQNNAFERLENMQMSNENLNKELDKMLELFKRLELEQKASDIANELDQLAQQQDKLEQDKSSNTEQSTQKQQELNKEFEELKKDLDQLEKLNKDQKKPLDLDEAQEKKEQISQNMKNAEEQLQQKQQKKASEQQKKASEQMKQMAQNLRSQMSQMQMQQSAEDINTIRRLLSNLLKLSKEQEELMLTVRKTHENDPKFTQLVQQQYKLKEDAVIIEDSLTALGKRVFQLQTFISDEVYKMKRDLKKSIGLLESKQRGPATASQQFAMSSANNLALMLSEVMDQMQQQMNKMSGSGSCSNPNGNNPGMPGAEDLKKLQEQLGQDLQKMGKQIKEGQGGSQMNKELAQMAEQQAAIRETLRKMRENMSQKQKNDTGVDKMMDEMDKIETDIVNKRITEQTLMRQKNIETRMLELEKAMREQDEKDERESKTATDFPKTPPAVIEQYLKKRNAQLNTPSTLPPELKPFYKDLVNTYIHHK